MRSRYRAPRRARPGWSSATTYGRPRSTSARSSADGAHVSLAGRSTSPGVSSPALISVRMRSCSGSQRLIEMPAAHSTLHACSPTASSTSSKRCAPATALETVMSARSSASSGRSGRTGGNAGAGRRRGAAARRRRARRRGRARAGARRRWSGRTACRRGARARRAPAPRSARGGTGGPTSSRARRRRRSRCGWAAGRPRRRARPGSRGRPSARARRARPARGAASEPIAATISAPIAGCSRITSHSGAVRRPGLRRIASGTPTLPMSCSSATWPTAVASSPSMPSSAATCRASSSTASECAAV